MYTSVKEWVNTCVECSMKKKSPTKKITEVMSLKAIRPWEIVEIDFLGPLPRTKVKNQYLLVFTDYFSKWIEVIPTKKISTEIIAESFVQRIICRYENPERVLLDRGKTFIGKIMMEIEKKLEIKQIKTGGYHLQTNE